jgi:hypothetical protein
MEAAFRGVATGGRGFLAVGVESEHGAAWFSANGEAWSKIDRELPVGSLQDVVGMQNGGFVVVGNDAEADLEAAAWVVSGDGSEWQRAIVPAAAPASNGHQLRRVWSFDDGYVAFGQSSGSLPENSLVATDDSAIFTSPDGLNWVRHDISSATTGQLTLRDYSAITDWSDGLLSVGPDDDGVVRVWLSSDGVQWAPVGEPVAFGTLVDLEPTVADVLVTSHGIVIGGYLVSDDGYVMIGTSN